MADEITLNQQVELKRLEMIHNALQTRANLIEKFLEKRKDIDRECDYPDDPIQVAQYQALYERNEIAARVVEVLPRESWQVSPEVYEDEDEEVETQFEQAWTDLGKGLMGNQSWFLDQKGSPIWEHLLRADILSGIGQFGLILLGIDDGKALSEPLEGVGDVPTPYPSPTQEGYEYRDSLYRESPSTNAVPQVNPVRTPKVPRDDPESGQNGAKNGQNGLESPENDPRSAPTQPFVPIRKLLYLRTFEQSLVQVTQFDTNPASPRRGQPVMYSITQNDPRETELGGVGLATATVYVHWTRVIHVAEDLGSSEWAARPRMKQVFNRLLDLRKTYGGSAEGYWQSCVPAWAFETHPSLGADVEIDKEDVRGMMQDFSSGLQRWLTLQGMGAKSLAPTTSDPTNHLNASIEAVCIKLGIPKRVFMGSERGELASGQDDKAWNDRLAHRQEFYLSPRLIAPFINRLIACGVLPMPADGYHVKWPDLTSRSDDEKAKTALTKTQALVAYSSGAAQTVMAPMDFYTRILGFTQKEAEAIVQAAEDYKAQKQEQDAQKALEQQKAMVDAGVVPDPTDPKQQPPQGGPGFPPAPPGKPPFKPGQPAVPGAPVKPNPFVKS